ncbi:MAG: type II toxin-antitoxin system VapC family toxin [Candidatus Scalindua sp.]
MIVVDTNIIVYLWLPSDFTEMAEKLLKKDSYWVSSTLWKFEFRNVVSSFYRRKLITYEQALEVIFNAEAQLVNSEYSVNSLKVMEKVKSSKCTAYDCEYVALAEVLNCNLVTNDKKILKSFPSITTDLKCIV